MMRSPMVRAARTVALVVVLAACGGADPPDTVASGQSGEETTTILAPDSTATSPEPVPAGESTTTAAPKQGPTDSRAPGPQSSARNPAPPRPPVTGTLTTPPTNRRVDEYLPPGVADQIFPPGQDAHLLLSSGKCDELLREIQQGGKGLRWGTGVPPSLKNLYLAAGHACLAQWSQAESAFRQIRVSELCGFEPDKYQGADSSFDDTAACQKVRGRVHQWTENLLKAHRANPAFVPNFPPPKP